MLTNKRTKELRTLNFIVTYKLKTQTLCTRPIERGNMDRCGIQCNYRSVPLAYKCRTYVQVQDETICKRFSHPFLQGPVFICATNLVTLIVTTDHFIQIKKNKNFYLTEGGCMPQIQKKYSSAIFDAITSVSKQIRAKGKSPSINCITMKSKDF